ncbi:MAG: tetratricopeptide repeat protein [Aequorivita sp.]|nr:tetratricopeptide repeat protein [Aequorivita sp.]
MKTKFVLLFTILLLAFSGKSIAQAPDDCAISLSYFTEPAKIKNYEAALPYYEKLVKECPNYNLAIYQYGVKMFEYFIDEKGDKSKVTNLIEAWELRLQNFPEQTKEGDVLLTIAQIKFDNNIGTKTEQFNAFDTVFKKYPEDFTSGKSLYTYFSLAVDLHNSGEKDLQEIFNLYDVVISKIDIEKNSLATKLTLLMDKEEAGTALTDKEQRAKDVYENNLGVYSTIEGSVNGTLGQLADCVNLVPFYEKDFEAKKNDIDWLKAASNRLDAKDCETPLSNKLAIRLHELEPSSISAYLLGKQAEAGGKSSKAMEYFNQAADLEKDNSKKARIYYSIAENHRKKGSFGAARTYYNKMLEVKPSAGIAYLKIAQMIGDSSNSCGNTVFEKRAINWLAAEMAAKAARVDGSVASSANAAASAYRQRAPQASDIFSEGMAGKTVTFNCWVGGSVRVPNL